MTLRAMATILLTLVALTLLAKRFLPELFWQTPATVAVPSPPGIPTAEAATVQAAMTDSTPIFFPEGDPPPTEPPTEPPGAAMPPEQLISQDIEPGSGAAVTAGQSAVVHYTGWLWDAAAPENKGRKFDSSRDRNDPFVFPLGAGRVIQGWDQGVAGMKVGGQRTLIIPPEMGYGARGAGGVIPPNATLVFEVDLLGV